MRLGPFALLSLAVLGGCAGQLRDYMGSGAPPAIVAPQLLRYGFDPVQSRCIAERLSAELTPSRLRKLARSAGSVSRGSYEPGRLTPRDFGWVVASMNHARSRRAFERALAICPPPLAIATAAPPAPPPPATAWLNLGAATSGQSIAVDASSIEREGSLRTAWFRMTDPGAQPSDNAYLLRIDCANRTINPQKRRRRAPDGSVAEEVDYPDNPLTVEGGTVMEIAWLSMCT